MLPFLMPKKMSSVIMMKAKKSGGLDPQGEEGENHALQSIAEDLIKAVHAKDTMGVMEALEDAFEVLDAAPHVEGPHIEGGE